MSVVRSTPNRVKMAKRGTLFQFALTSGKKARVEEDNGSVEKASDEGAETGKDRREEPVLAQVLQVVVVLSKKVTKKVPLMSTCSRTLTVTVMIVRRIPATRLIFGLFRRHEKKDGPPLRKLRDVA